MVKYRIKNVLVPTDFSRIARHGLHHAERIAKNAKARITLLNVVEPIGRAASTSGMLGVCDRLEKKAREANQKKLERITAAAEETNEKERSEARQSYLKKALYRKCSVTTST